MLIAVFQMMLAEVALHLPKQWGDKLTSHPSKQERVFQSVWKADCAVKPNGRTHTKTKPVVLPAAASMKEEGDHSKGKKNGARYETVEVWTEFIWLFMLIHIRGNIDPKMYLRNTMVCHLPWIFIFWDHLQISLILLAKLRKHVFTVMHLWCTAAAAGGRS